MQRHNAPVVVGFGLIGIFWCSFRSCLKHNCIIIRKKELLQCFLSGYTLSNRVSLYGTYVMTEKKTNKKGSCLIPVAVWASIKHICDALPFWLTQSVDIRGCKTCCQSARAFLSLWKCKGIHTSNYTYFEITGVDFQTTFHNNINQNWGRPSPHPSHQPIDKPSKKVSCMSYQIELGNSSNMHSVKHNPGHHHMHEVQGFSCQYNQWSVNFQSNLNSQRFSETFQGSTSLHFSQHQTNLQSPVWEINSSEIWIKAKIKSVKCLVPRKNLFPYSGIGISEYD